MEYAQLITQLQELLKRVNPSQNDLPNNPREAVESLISIDASSIDPTVDSAALVTLVQLCQSALSYLIKNEMKEKVRNPEHVEKVLAQNKKLRHMLQLHQRSFLTSIVSSNSCPHCCKSFVDESLLESHFQRRHEQREDDTAAIHFPLLDKINAYRGKSKEKNDQALDEITCQINELRDKLRETEAQIKCEQEARKISNDTIAQLIQEKVTHIEKKLSDFYLGDNQLTDHPDQSQLCVGQTQDAFLRLQISLLKQLASEVASLKLSILQDRVHSSSSSSSSPPPAAARQLTSESHVSGQSAGDEGAYQQVEHFVKKRFHELNLQYDSPGISESDLENALKCIEQQRASKVKQSEVSVESTDGEMKNGAQSTAKGSTRPIPAARTSKGPTSILKKCKSNDQFDLSKESKKIQWSQ